MLYLCKKRCMKDVLKISILLILVLTLATIPAVKDSITAKQDEINGSALYYRLILHNRDSVNHNLKRIYNKDAFKFKDDYFREKMREPWIGDVLRDIFFK